MNSRSIPRLLLILGVVGWLPRTAASQDAPALVFPRLSDESPVVSTTTPESVDFEIRETTVHELPDRTVTIHRVKPPDLPASEPSEGLSQEQTRQKTILQLSGTVVDNRATYLRWRHAGADYSAWSNVDWNFLSGRTEFTLGDRYFVVLSIVNNLQSASLPSGSPYTIPGELPFDGPALLPVIGDFTVEKAFGAVVAMHELYLANELELLEAFESRELRLLEREAERLASPPVLNDIEIYYWKAALQREGGSR